MGTPDKTISVIIPNFNGREYIHALLAALYGQTRPPDEILVVDDASTDDSISVISSFDDTRSIINLIRNETNMGVCASVNTGIQYSSSGYIFLSAVDHLIAPTALEDLEDALKRHPVAGLSFGQTGWYALEAIQRHPYVVSGRYPFPNGNKSVEVYFNRFYDTSIEHYYSPEEICQLFKREFNHIQPY